MSTALVFLFFQYLSVFSSSIIDHFLYWARVSEGSQRKCDRKSCTPRISWKVISSGSGGPSGNRTKERLPPPRMKYEEEGALCPCGIPGRGQSCSASKGRKLGAQEGSQESAEMSFHWSDSGRGWVRCPRPWYLRTGQKGMGRSQGRGVSQGMFGCSGS